VCCNPCHEKSDLGERGAAVDRADGHPIQIRICWRGQGPPLLPMFEEEQPFRVDRRVREAFLKLKEYLATPPVLCKPQLGTLLRLYFVVTERAISSILVQEQGQVQKPIYFVSKVLQGPEVRYQALDDGDKKEEDFTNGGRGHPPKHLKFFLLVFSK